MCCLSRSLSHTHTHILCAAARRHSSAGTVLSLLVLVGAAPGRRRHPGGGGGGSKLRALQHAADQSGFRGGGRVSLRKALLWGSADEKRKTEKNEERKKWVVERARVGQRAGGGADTNKRAAHRHQSHRISPPPHHAFVSCEVGTGIGGEHPRRAPPTGVRKTQRQASLSLALSLSQRERGTYLKERRGQKTKPCVCVTNVCSKCQLLRVKSGRAEGRGVGACMCPRGHDGLWGYDCACREACVRACCARARLGVSACVCV